MYCDSGKKVGEGAKGLGPLPPPPHPLPQSLKGGEFWVEPVPLAPAQPNPFRGLVGRCGGRQNVEKPPSAVSEQACPPALQPWPSPHDFSALGLDFGSRYVKVVYGGAVGGVRRRCLDSLDFYRDYLVRREGRLEIDWEKLGLKEPDALVVTGYGKGLLQEHFPAITEVRATFLGARAQTGLGHFILLEMGGQDTKVLYVKEGRVFDFLTNDRCAAGTGRYLENMAAFLKMPLREFAAAKAEPVDISQTCAIFGESELIGHLLGGVAVARIAAGVNLSVARRALALVRRYPSSILVFTGGVAKNRAVTNFMEEHGRHQVIVPAFPQFTGALGCFLEALARVKEPAHAPAAP